jgi:hypothetical protein
MTNHECRMKLLSKCLPNGGEIRSKKGASCRRLCETPFRAAVGNSSPFLTNLPFHDFPNYFNHESWFTILVKSRKGRFVKKGDELPTADLEAKMIHRKSGIRNSGPYWTD